MCVIPVVFSSILYSLCNMCVFATHIIYFYTDYLIISELIGRISVCLSRRFVFTLTRRQRQQLLWLIWMYLVVLSRCCCRCTCRNRFRRCWWFRSQCNPILLTLLTLILLSITIICSFSLLKFNSIELFISSSCIIIWLMLKISFIKC